MSKPGPSEVLCVVLVLLAALAGCDPSRPPSNADGVEGDRAVAASGANAVSSAILAVGTGDQKGSGSQTNSRGKTDSGSQADPDGKTDSGPPPPCSDGKDNDGDGLVDWEYDLGCYGPSDSTEGGLKSRELDNGWSVFEPSKDTKIIYVSSSAGNDANRGTSPAKPKKTLAAALRAARNKRPDWVLLARGDTWTETLAVKEGRSRSEPFVVATYGKSTKRPLLKTGEDTGLNRPGNYYNNFAVVGIAFYAHTRDPDSSNYTNASGSMGFDFYSSSGATGQGVLLEDCWFNFYTGNVIQGDGVNKDIVLRRNIITNNYSTTSHSQGIYSYNASILLEENVFDHNGWYKQQIGDGNETTDGQATFFNHNTYFGAQNKTTFRRNIFMRASSVGNKWVAEGPGGSRDILVEDNLYIDGEIGIDIGGNDNVASHRFKNVTISNNVILDIGRSRPTNRTLGWCLNIDDWDGGEVSRNLFLHQPSAAVKDVYAIYVGGVTRDLVIEENVIHGLRTDNALVILSDGASKQAISFNNNKIQSQIHGAVLIETLGVPTNYTFAGNSYFSKLSAKRWFAIAGRSGDLAAWQKIGGATESAKKVDFPDPTRSIETYQKSLGETAAIEAFITAVLAQSKYNWRAEYTAASVNNWIRAGFVPQMQPQEQAAPR